MGEVIAFPQRRRQKYIASLGCFQSEEKVDYGRILSEYEVISGPGEKMVVHVPIHHNPPSEDDSHAIMTVVSHLLYMHEGRLFMPIGPTMEATEKRYVIREY